MSWMPRRKADPAPIASPEPDAARLPSAEDDRLAAELGALRQERDVLRQDRDRLAARVSELEAALAQARQQPAGPDPAVIQRAIVRAEGLAQQIEADARQQADHLRDEAQREADRVRAQAAAEAQRLMDAARAEAARWAREATALADRYHALLAEVTRAGTDALAHVRTALDAAQAALGQLDQAAALAPASPGPDLSPATASAAPDPAGSAELLDLGVTPESSATDAVTEAGPQPTVEAGEAPPPPLDPEDLSLGAADGASAGDGVDYGALLGLKPEAHPAPPGAGGPDPDAPPWEDSGFAAWPPAAGDR